MGRTRRSRKPAGLRRTADGIVRGIFGLLLGFATCYVGHLLVRVVMAEAARASLSAGG